MPRTALLAACLFLIGACGCSGSNDAAAGTDLKEAIARSNADKASSGAPAKMTAGESAKKPAWPFTTPIPEGYAIASHKKWNGHDLWTLQGQKREFKNEQGKSLDVVDTLLVAVTKQPPDEKEVQHLSVSVAVWAAESAGGREFGSTNLPAEIPQWQIENSTFGLSGFYQLGGFPDAFHAEKDFAMKDPDGREVMSIGGVVAKREANWVLLGMACLAEKNYGDPLRDVGEKLRAALNGELVSKGQTK